MHPPRTVSIPCPAPEDSTPDICVHVLEYIQGVAVVRALQAKGKYSCCCMPRLQLSHARMRAYAHTPRADTDTHTHTHTHTHTQKERARLRSRAVVSSHDVTYVGHATPQPELTNPRRHICWACHNAREERETCRGLGYAPPRPAGCAGQQGPPSERGAERVHSPRPRLRTP